MGQLYAPHTFHGAVIGAIPNMTHPYTFAATDRFLTQTIAGIDGEQVLGEKMIYMDAYIAGSDFLYPAYKGRALSTTQQADVFAHPLYKQACNFYGDIWRFYNDTKRLPLHPYEALMAQTLEGKLSSGIGGKMAGLATSALTSAIVNGLEMGKTVRDKVLEQKEKDGILSAAEAQELLHSKHYRSLVDKASSGGVLSDAENEFMYTYKTQEEIRQATARIMMESEHKDIDTSASGGAGGGDGDRPKRLRSGFVVNSKQQEHPFSDPTSPLYGFNLDPNDLKTAVARKFDAKTAEVALSPEKLAHLLLQVLGFSACLLSLRDFSSSFF